MYEMEGPLCGSAAPTRRSLGRPMRRKPATSTADPHEAPVARLFLRSGVAPGSVSVPGDEHRSSACRMTAQGFPGKQFQDSLDTHR